MSNESPFNFNQSQSVPGYNFDNMTEGEISSLITHWKQQHSLEYRINQQDAAEYQTLIDDAQAELDKRAEEAQAELDRRTEEAE